MQQHLTWLYKDWSSLPRLKKSIQKITTNCYSTNLQVYWFSEACAVPQASLPSCRSGRLYLQPCTTDLMRKWGVYNNSIVAVHMENKFSKYTWEINSVMPPSPSHGEAFSSHETRIQNDSNRFLWQTEQMKAKLSAHSLYLKRSSVPVQSPFHQNSSDNLLLSSLT